MTLHAYFAAIEAGATSFPHAALAAELPAGAFDALRASRLVRPGRDLAAWSCDRPARRCGREVMESAPGSAKPFVAVCEGSCEEEDRCEDVDLTAADLAQTRLDVGELSRALRKTHRLEGATPSFAAGAPPPTDPVRLGEERSETATRDVFLALAPRSATFASFLTSRERASRATLVLVPTARHLAPEVATRHAPGAHVEVEALEDTIVVREGVLARVTKLRLVANPTADANAHDPEDASEPIAAVRPGGIAAQLGATHFDHVVMKAIDGHTLLIGHRRKRLRATYIDLDLATKTRTPSREWALLLDVCAGHGKFRWKTYGTMVNAKQRVSVLQAKLRVAFGLEDNPFHKFRVVDGWRAKFFASSEIGSDET